MFLFVSDKKSKPPKEVDLFGELGSDSNAPSLLDELKALDSSPTKLPSEENSPERFSAQWNKLFGQEPSNIDDSTVPDLRLDTLGQDGDEFGSFFSSTTKEELSSKTSSEKPILPSQLFDLDQSLFSLQSPRQGTFCKKSVQLISRTIWDVMINRMKNSESQCRVEI